MNKNVSIETGWRHYAATFVSEAKHRGLEQEQINACLQYAKPLYLSGLPVIFEASHFAELVGYSEAYVFGVVKRTERYYRSFSIAKRSGGERVIAEPLPSLKEIQRWILVNILNHATVHPAAKAFRAGRSIKENARFHKAQNYVLTIDVKDFFPSIRAGRVFNAYRRLGYTQQIASLLTDISCLNQCLPQGAPTSPALSNIVCYPLDARLFGYARKLNLRYTRYADDITFSGAEIGSDLVNRVYKILGEFGFQPNLKKTRLLRPSQRQEVTGIVVNEKIQAPRETRRELRQHAYYIEKYGLEDHAAFKRNNRAHFKEHLLGRAGFVRHLNSTDRDANALVASILNKD